MGGEPTSGGMLPLGGDIIAAGTALAGLILVYLGAVANEYGRFPTTDQRAVRDIFIRRAWFATFGIIFAISASGIALGGKFLASSFWVGLSAFLLVLALIWSVVIAVMITSDI